MKTVDINFTETTLIISTDYFVLGNVLIIPQDYRIYNFNSKEELDIFSKNNKHLELEDDFIIPQIAAREYDEYKEIKYIIFAQPNH